MRCSSPHSYVTEKIVYVNLLNGKNKLCMIVANCYSMEKLLCDYWNIILYLLL